ncbi:hypothetical protein VNI00_015100 [Paramarasmius palmivorus]|uniref:Uncharacterized protein n=1 Tax=Paramarasmius palmivorus TaxID=297713 RepID=A0AAW0BNN1_9AGAR
MKMSPKTRRSIIPPTILTSLTLQDDNLALALKAVIIGYLITDGREIPWELQFDAVRMSYEKDEAAKDFGLKDTNIGH